MKRALAILILILSICAISAPFINGLLMEKVVKQSLQDLGNIYANSGSDISIQVVDYQRGYATSEIEWKINLGSMKSLYKIDEIVFTDHARHGLTGIVSQTSLMKNDWYQNFVNNKLNGTDPLSITTAYRLSGDVSATILLDKFSLQENGQTVNVQPAKVVVEGDSGMKNIRIDSDFAGLTAPGKIDLKDLSLTARLEKISTYIWDGDISMRLGSSSAVDKKGTFEISNMLTDYKIAYDKTKKSLNIGIDYGADKLALGDQGIGRTQLHFGVNNLDGDGYEEFMKLYSATISDIVKDLPTLDEAPEELQKRIQEKMSGAIFQLMSAYEKLLKQGLELQLTNLQVELPEGKAMGDFVLSLKKDMTFMQFAPLLQQPQLALTIFDINSNAVVPKALMGDNTTFMVPLFPGMQTGLFVEDGENFRHSAQSRDGKLFLNDKEVSLSEL